MKNSHPLAQKHALVSDAEIASAVERACSRIAPTWPLDRFIAVNPLWGFINAPLPTVAARLRALSGARLLAPRALYRAAWRDGRLRPEHLEEAIERTRSACAREELEELLSSGEPSAPRRALVTDTADLERDLRHEMPWRDFVRNDISQQCAAYFDDGQARFRPSREGGLYASWHRHALADHSPRLLMGFQGYRQAVRALPSTRTELIVEALEGLGIPAREREDYLTALLLNINGWAAWCAYLRWTARQRQSEDDSIIDLLAIRLAWEWLLLRSAGRRLRAAWQLAMARWPSETQTARVSESADWMLQRGLEIAYQTEICRGLERNLPCSDEAHASGRPPVQAAFCIDVRSEVMRRALESEDDAIRTVGFAGFFGAPIEYLPVGAAEARPQLPGLLAARLRVTDVGVPNDAGERRSARIALDRAFKAFRSSAISSFSFVESLGLFYAGKLIGDSLGRARPLAAERTGLDPTDDHARKPRLTAHADGRPLAIADKVELAAGILRAMSLTRGLARIVLLVGHGSTSVNNPHAAGLDCGACCGQTGEINARAVAALLNDPAVRAGLSARGIDVPADTLFVPALHDTTSDDVELFDLDEVDPAHSGELARLRGTLARAAQRARAERAPALGIRGLGNDELHRALVARAHDWSQVRPEWGLAGNASFIAARRECTRKIDLKGRAFLHDYRWEEDRDFSILELIMTAPMVVAHWINLQYYASTVDNERYGSGNKVLHNVVGGHLGVFEGNSGDLRIGLPLQSLHDGERWVHSPLRLSVFIEAPQERISEVLDKHEVVRQLVNNEWLFLFQIDRRAGAVHAYEGGQWRRAFARGGVE